MFCPSYSRLKHFAKINSITKTSSVSSFLKSRRALTSLSPLTAFATSKTFLPDPRSFSTTSCIFSKTNEYDGVGSEENSQENSEKGAAIDEEALLAEYYRSYKEEVWVSGNDDDREVQWMEMLGNRGQEGVFDLHELIDVLRAENVQDILTVKVPHDFNYADYLVIGTGFSFRHLKSVMEYVKKLHKGKKWKKDSHAVIEGLDAEDWLVIDMGNIVLHLFHPDARIQWDLETLWTVGPEFDDLILTGRRNNAELDAYIYVDEASRINWDLDRDHGSFKN